MTDWLALLPGIPLAAAVAASVIRGREARRVVAVAAICGMAALALATLYATSSGEVLVTRAGGWPASIAIPLVVDHLAALLLCVTALMTGACTAMALLQGLDRNRAFLPLVLLMVAGVNGAYMSGDLFSLFVFIEMMLVPSYGLLTLGGGAGRLRAAGTYVAVNLLASTILLIGVGLVYAVGGTVNIAALAASGESRSMAAALGVVLFALAMKAAVVPLHTWLPQAYASAPAVVTALFSGLLTKVAVYAVTRVHSVAFDGDPALGTVILVVAGVTMTVGVLEAVGRNEVRPILAHHMVSQVGYLFVGLGLFTGAALAAGVFYLVQYVLVKGTLFLVAAALESTYGTGRLDRLGGALRASPLLGIAFGMAALSLVGLPPFSGFAAKLLLVRASWDAEAYVIGAVVILVSLGTLISMLKIWNGVFWGERDPASGTTAPVPRRLVVPALVLAVLSLALGVGAEGLLSASEQAAAGLVDTGPYVEAVAAP